MTPPGNNRQGIAVKRLVRLAMLNINIYQCSALQDSKETSITCAGRVLILHLPKYSNLNGNITKDTKLVECLPENNHILSVPIKPSDSVSFSNRYSLVATINHSGTLQAGHYWAYIKDVAKLLG